MINSISIETIIDVNNNHHLLLNSSKHNSIFSTETNRHISFNDKYDDKQEEKRTTLTHIDFIHASENEILHRYLSYFEQCLPLFINKNLENFNNKIDIEKFQLSNTRIHHKDDIELYHLKRIQITFENIEKNEKLPLDKDIIIIIDAFHIYIENLIRKNVFINQCKTEQKLNENEFLSIININYGDLFNIILSSFNHICHSSLNIIKPSKIAEILIFLFHNLFSNMNDYSMIKILSLLIENYHHLNFYSNDSIQNKTISSFSSIKNFPNNINRQYLLALDILMKSIEESTIKCPYNIQLLNCKYMYDSTKTLLTKIFYEIRTSNHEKYSIENQYDCIQVFRAIFKKIFNYSSLSMIKTIEDKQTYMDFKIDEKDFEIVIIFFKHLSRMNKRCTNEYEQNFIFDYFSTILFGDLHRKIISKKIRQIFQLFIQHFEQIQWQ
ncbi:unnamed protein product [Rotaria sordida]|uniref:Uncharacterized protein n=1 Tax=Rotaria sordida TaxID=392033 RepID=A0A818R8X5_9BILA|nr:unnamed protein product [Rotaria sordida]CAF3547465.1 unnamed protein product [Rotaria sordida]CAF3653269.1 unnamed protein product [Rotaria sordida]